VLGDGANDANNLSFLEVVRIVTAANINIGILEITGNRVLIYNSSGGNITVITGAGNITLAAGHLLFMRYSGATWIYSNQFYNANIVNDIIAGNDITVGNDLIVSGTIYGEHENYDSGWLLNEMGGAGVADWTAVNLGNDPTDPADNLTHSLNSPLSELFVRILLSTDGTDNNSFETIVNTRWYTGATTLVGGITIYQVDNNNIKIQTGSNGIVSLTNTGASLVIDTQNWYYKIKIWKLG